MPQPHLRAADSDRAAVAEVLGKHMSAGRLTVAEYEERLAQAYAAKTYGELDELTADLPAPARSSAPAPATSPGPVPQQCSVPSPAQYGHHPSPWGWDNAHSWRAWLSTALIVITIWAVTSLASWEFQYFWPVWVIGPWGAVLLAQTLTGKGGEDDRKDRRLPG
jgi:uncharacterized integral membrane protein